MRVAVIGAGVTGVATAYFLARLGHQVTVIEQHGNVCEQASLGHAGLLGPGHLMPSGAPGMPRQILAHWFRAGGSSSFRPGLQPSQWRWLRKWLRECTLERMLANREKMQRLALYSQQLLTEINLTNNLDFAQRSGVLQLFRHAKEQSQQQTGLALLADTGIPFQQLDEAGCRLCEPALNANTPIAGGLYFPQDSHGNGVLFAKQLKAISQSEGVDYQFSQLCQQITTQHNGVTLQLQQRAVQFDAAVLCAGVQSSRFFDSLGLTLPLVTMVSSANTANLKNIEDSPKVSIIDSSRQITISRMDKRIRVAGLPAMASSGPLEDQRLRDTANDWFPDAANYDTGSSWSGSTLMLPDNAPLLGPGATPHIYLNLAHAEFGWAMALGAAKIVADLISGKTPPIDTTGLTLDRQ